ALLEYVEQQGQPDTFQRVVASTARYCDSAELGPLIAGRYWIYQARCVFRLGAYDPAKPRDLEAHALLARAEALAAGSELPHLQFDVHYARLLLAAICNYAIALSRHVGAMNDMLYYSLPISWLLDTSYR